MCFDASKAEVSALTRMMSVQDEQSQPADQNKSFCLAQQNLERLVPGAHMHADVPESVSIADASNQEKAGLEETGALAHSKWLRLP